MYRKTKKTLAINFLRYSSISSPIILQPKLLCLYLFNNNIYSDWLIAIFLNCSLILMYVIMYTKKNPIVTMIQMFIVQFILLHPRIIIKSIIYVFCRVHFLLEKTHPRNWVGFLLGTFSPALNFIIYLVRFSTITWFSYVAWITFIVLFTYPK